MKKRVMRGKDFPFNITHQMRLYYPICDNNPYATYLLAYCFQMKTLSEYEYQVKTQEETARREALSEEEKVEEMEIQYDAYMDRLLNDYNGESFLNEEEDAQEGIDGIFDLNFADAVDAMGFTYFREVPDKGTLKNSLIEAYRFLQTKGFLKSVWLNVQLDEPVIEGALMACYPDLFEQNTNNKEKEEQVRKKESKKVQYHNNMATRCGLPATLTLPEWIETLNDFNWKCAYCREKPYTILEHIQPMILGGGTHMDNCVPACASCNTTKRDIHPEFLPPDFVDAVEQIQQYFAKRKKRG